MIEYLIDPIAKPRMTRSDKWNKRDCVMRYRAFCDHVKALGIEIPDQVRIIFNIPMPPSWPKYKKAEYNGKPHQQKPDIDNLQKAIFDAVFKDDSHISRVDATKKWALQGSIQIGSLEKEGVL